MIRLIHTADLHLGVTGYGRINPATGLHQRLEDYLATVDQIVDHAIACNADALLVAGDIFHSKTPDSAQQREFARRVRKLTAAGVVVILLVGNHDAVGRANVANPLDVYSALEVEGVHVLRSPKLITIQTRSGPLQVAGLPHLSKSTLEARREGLAEDMAAGEHEMEAALTAIVANLASKVDPAVPSVLTAHWGIDVALAGSEGQMMLGRGQTITLAALQRPEFSYVAMGHIHKPQAWYGTPHDELPPVVYPGSPDRVDFGEESDVKGFWQVDLVGRSCTMDRIPLSVRPFLTIAPDLTDAAYPTDALIAAISGDFNVESAVVRLAYTIASDRASQVDESRVREALAAAFHVAWRPEIIPAESRVRNPELAASCAADPMAALGRYIDAMPELAERRAALLAAGAALLAGLAGEPLLEVGAPS